MENNKKSIFRSDAIDYQRQKWVGKALLLSKIPAPVIAGLCLVFMLALVLAMIFLDYSRRIDVDGEVITLPHSINIYSPQQGYIITTFVKVGDRVKKGDPLYELDVSRNTSSGSVSTVAVDSIKAQITNLYAIIAKLKSNKESTLQNLQVQIDNYAAAHKATEKVVNDARDGMRKMNESLKNYERYLKKGLITQDQLNYQRAQSLSQQSAWQALSNQSNQETIQLSQLRSDRLTRGADFDNQITQSESQVSDLERQLAENRANNSIIISAKLDGVIESLSVTPGQMVESSASLAQIKPVDNVKYYLLLWLPDNSLPYVKVGDGINIRYNAFPSDKFGQFPGKITSISSIPASPQEMSSYSSGSNQQKGSFYKILISIHDTEFSDKGKKLEISGGLQAKAIVFLETKPLYQWAIAPINKIKNSVTGVVSE
ncbi:HlyD family secretion protein [Pantoea sp. BAV 3049]|uniref:HlyD family secretion protein n=1 Tax=Pantoea sp. BAV 3049 TaxID=2654188 RepID=UPI00131BBE49|nr:HlyD family secretion protein [Pantoea sp. BAV 3049]